MNCTCINLLTMKYVLRFDKLIHCTRTSNTRFSYFGYTYLRLWRQIKVIRNSVKVCSLYVYPVCQQLKKALVSNTCYSQTRALTIFTLASSYVTSRLLLRSHLFPIRSLATWPPPYCSTVFNHVWIFSNDSYERNKMFVYGKQCLVTRWPIWTVETTVDHHEYSYTLDSTKCV